MNVGSIFVLRFLQCLVGAQILMCWIEGIRRAFGRKLIENSVPISEGWKVLVAEFAFAGGFLLILRLLSLSLGFFDYLWCGWALLGTIGFLVVGRRYVVRVEHVGVAFLAAFWFPFYSLFVTWVSWIVGYQLGLVSQSAR